MREGLRFKLFKFLYKILNLRTLMFCQWCRTFFDLPLPNENKGLSFFNYFITRNLSYTYINTNRIYANLTQVC